MQNFIITDNALRALETKDPLLAELIAVSPRPEYHLEESLFTGLVHIISGQQISQSVWRVIWQRLTDVLEEVTPQAVLRIGAEGLRTTGLSARKTDYIIEAAEKFCQDSFQLAVLSDDLTLRREALLSLRGVGRWTVEMLDILCFAEPDVFSTGDFGLRRALANLYGLVTVDDEAMARAAERFSPYSSTAALYLWQSLDLSTQIIDQGTSKDGYLASPVGPLYARVGKKGIVEIAFTDLTEATPAQELRHPLLRLLEYELDAYFTGNLRRFTVPIDRSSGTPFQQQVWQTIIDIPYGETITYGDLARKIGRPTAYRAVANALGRNPVSIVAPCHRIIGANGKLTGFGGGLSRKRFLLDLEKENK